MQLLEAIRQESLPVTRKQAAFLGYVLFFFFMFAVFLYVGFPYDVLKLQVANRLRASLVPPGYTLSIDRMGPAFPLGVTLSGLRLNRDQGKAPVLSVRKVSLTVPVHGLPFLIFGRFKLHYAIHLAEGGISGSATLSRNRTKLSSRIKGIPLKALASVAEEYGIQLLGELRGRLELDLPENNPAKGDGVLDLSVEEGGVGASKILGFLALPALPLPEAKARLKLEKGRININEGDVGLNGPDLTVGLTGNVTLSPNAMFSQIRCKGTIRPSPGLEAKLLEGLQKDFGFIIPFIQNSKDLKGNYGFQILGSLARPQLYPAR